MVLDTIIGFLRWALDVIEKHAAAAEVLTSIVIALFVVVAWRESRREARMRYVMRKAEELYTPVFHEIELSKGKIFNAINLPNRNYNPWSDEIVPRFKKYGYLASSQLRLYYNILLTDEKARGEFTEKFCKQVQEEYDQIVRKLDWMTGAQSRIRYAVWFILWKIFTPIRRFNNWRVWKKAVAQGHRVSPARPPKPKKRGKRGGPQG